MGKGYYSRSARRNIAGVAVALLAATFGGLYVWGNALAADAWRDLGMPRLALALDRSDAPLAMTIGDSYFGSAPQGSYDTTYDPALAKSAFAKAVSIDPGILWGHYMLARIVFVEGDFATALTEIDAELAANPENLRSLYMRGLIYLYRNRPGDLALAARDFSAFSKWSPGEWAGYNDLAFTLSKEGQYAKAVAALEQAFQNVPGAKQNPWLWNSLGLAQLNESEYAKAQASFEKALPLAENLTLEEWRRAYTGDNPHGDAASIEAFRQAIRKNIATAQAGAAIP